MATATRQKISKATRNEFAGRSTGTDRTGYYSTKGHAINAFDGALAGSDCHLDREAFVDYNGDTGRANHPICDDDKHVVGCAVLSWYRMPSGNYEFTGYIA